MNGKIENKILKLLVRQAIGKVVSVPETLAFPISPQSIRVSSYNKASSNGYLWIYL